MANSRKIEIFSAGCAVCDEFVKQVRAEGCPSCDIIVLDMNDADVVARAQRHGIQSVPAVAIDGKLAECCAGRGPDIDALKAAGLGRPLN